MSAPRTLYDKIFDDHVVDRQDDVDLDDLVSIKRKLRQLEFEGKVVVQDSREHSTIDYTLNVPRMSADKFVTGALTMRYELEDVDGNSYIDFCFGDTGAMFGHSPPAIARALGKCVERGLVYKGKKPVHWCIHCRTALAEAEVEYEAHTSPSIFVEFLLDASSREELARRVPALAGRDAAVLIWTTTPWTIPSNLAIAFHPEFDYGAYSVNGRLVIVAEALAERVSQAVGRPFGSPVARMKGADLEALRRVDPDLVEKEAMLLGAALRFVFDALPDDGRALVVGHSPTNEAAVLGLAAEVVAPRLQRGRGTGRGRRHELAVDDADLDALAVGVAGGAALVENLLWVHRPRRARRQSREDEQRDGERCLQPTTSVG